MSLRTLVHLHNSSQFHTFQVNHQSLQWNACAQVNNFFSNLIEFVDFSNLRGATEGWFISFSGLIHFRHRVMRFTANEVTWYKFPPLSFLLLGTSCLGRPPGDGLRSPFGRRAVRQRGYGLRLLIFKMANNKVDLGQIRSEEIVYSRFIKIPLG